MDTKLCTMADCDEIGGIRMAPPSLSLKAVDGIDDDFRNQMARKAYRCLERFIFTQTKRQLCSRWFVLTLS